MASFASLIRSARAATKEAKPFFSAVDKAVEEMPRNKGTGKEFLTELTKKPGVKKAELEDRGIKAALEARLGEKLTKDDVRKLMEEKPPAQLREDILSDDVDNHYASGPTEYEKYQLPGGENYREILLKLPTFSEAKNTQLMELEANIRRMNPDDYPPGYVQGMVNKVQELKAEKARMGEQYHSPHWDENANVLAHMRVSDRFIPGQYGEYIVETIKNGKRSWAGSTGTMGTRKKADEMAQKLRDQGKEAVVSMVGPGKDGKKVLHVEEIQSDWHQEGRKNGYRGNHTELPQGYEVKEVDAPGGRKEYRVFEPNGNVFATGMSADSATRNAIENLNGGRKVPDAPFKKNWHELAMKRLINYASENGYDSIVITPGAEQAKRYDLSKQIDSVVVNPYRAERGEYTLQAIGKDGKTVIDKNDVQLQDLDDYIGKDLADKARQQLVDYGKSNLTGVDLQVGGEGMKGFYDKILPDYLRGFGKQYGADVGTMKIETGQEMSRGPNGSDMIPTYQPTYVDAHHFPITPQMREDVTSKGLPLYQKVGIPATGAGAGAEMLPTQEEPQYAMGGAVTAEYNTNPDMQDGGRVIQGPAFKRGGKVKFTDNPDTMYLEVNSKRK